MFFGKRKPVLPTATNTGASNSSKNLGSGESRTSRSDVISKTGIKVIENSANIPIGTLCSGEQGELPLARRWRAHFAVLRDAGLCHVLVTPKQWGSPQMLEIVRRVKAMDGVVKTLLHPASEEIIKQVYETHHESDNKIKSENTSEEEFITNMIRAALQMKASDIHIESRERSAYIYFRVNGERVLWKEIASSTAYSVGSVLFVHADSASKDVSWNIDQVSDCVVDWPVDDRDVQLRFSSAPIFPAGSFHVVLRLLVMEAQRVDVSKLGYSLDHLKVLEVATTGAAGMVLICGPTNSGKSTSLQALTQNIYSRRGDKIKIISVEDPVEYIIEGACQISVGRKRKTIVDEHSKSAFTTILRGTLRQDPDVVIVGEIRDYESASVVKDLVLSGRKVLATLHTASAFAAFMRLREIGVPWEIITMGGFISAVVYQRLVPVLCPHCSLPVREAMDRLPKETFHRLQQVVDIVNDNARVRGDGCPHCHHTGVVGRTVCAEVIMPDNKMLQMLSSMRLIEAERHWRDSGFTEIGGVSVLAHAIQKIKAGLVSPMDVEDQIAPLTTDIVREDDMFTHGELSVLAGH